MCYVRGSSYSWKQSYLQKYKIFMKSVMSQTLHDPCSVWAISVEKLNENKCDQIVKTLNLAYRSCIYDK